MWWWSCLNFWGLEISSAPGQGRSLWSFFFKRLLCGHMKFQQKGWGHLGGKKMECLCFVFVFFVFLQLQLISKISNDLRLNSCCAKLLISAHPFLRIYFELISSLWLLKKDFSLSVVYCNLRLWLAVNAVCLHLYSDSGSDDPSGLACYWRLTCRVADLSGLYGLHCCAKRNKLAGKEP